MDKTPIGILLDAAGWRELPAGVGEPDGLPYATHTGILRIGDAELTVYQLSTGERVIDAGDLERLFGVDDQAAGTRSE